MHLRNTVVGVHGKENGKMGETPTNELDKNDFHIITFCVFELSKTIPGWGRFVDIVFKLRDKKKRNFNTPKNPAQKCNTVHDVDDCCAILMQAYDFHF